MDNIQLGIHPLHFEMVCNIPYLQDHIYPDMYKNYYWSEDFTPEYYIAQAKAGFIAVTDFYEERELLLPEIQFTYALLNFKNLHISKKVRKLIREKKLTIHIEENFSEVALHIGLYHKDSWLTPRYMRMLKATKNIDKNFKLITATIKEKDGTLIAGEIGYIIGKTYTSLSGFSSQEKAYRNYGTAQLVLLALYLKEHNFTFWNLGQPYMDYKMALGAKVYEREDFLKQWFEATSQRSLHIR
jgi:Leu/Phe-tRNA-protein transferase